MKRRRIIQGLWNETPDQMRTQVIARVESIPDRLKMRTQRTCRDKVPDRKKAGPSLIVAKDLPVAVPVFRIQLQFERNTSELRALLASLSADDQSVRDKLGFIPFVIACV